MKSARMVLLVVVSLVLSRGAFGQHNRLLPRPQEIRYGSGRLSVKGLGIRFASPPASEDRFAAAQLVRALKDRCGVHLPVWEAATSDTAIVLERTGPIDTLPVPDEPPGPESREAYELKVSSEGVQIRGRSSAAIFYGVETLRQLVEGEGESAVFPEVEIRDWPSFAYRGTMVDMSHGPLPTEAEVKRQLDFLARWKANQYYFYTEVSIELEGYALVNPDGRFTQDEVRRIIAYGRERHIDVIPCLELYGHLHDLFRVEKYSDLAAFPHGGEFNPSNAKVMALLNDWVGQITSLFPSPFVHIGFDETYQIEEAAKQAGAGATPARLFVEQLGNVARLFQQRGKRVMAWGDIMVKYPEIVSDLPRGLTPVAWYYEAAPDPEYKRWLVPLVAKGIPHLVATTIHCWNQITPDFDTSFENIDTFLAAGRKSKALGLINTIWTDDAQDLYRMTWPGLAYGAAASWQSTAMDRARFFSDYAQQMYPTPVAPEVAAALEGLNKSEGTIQKVLGFQSLLEMWPDPLLPGNLARAQGHRDELRQARLLAEGAQEHLYRALALGGDPTTLSSLLFGSRLLDYAGMKNLYAAEMADVWAGLGPHPTKEQVRSQVRRNIYVADHAPLPDLEDAITGLREVYRANWLAEYTPYRLGSALGRWDAEYEMWRQMQDRFTAFVGNFRDGEPLPPLDSVVHPH